MAQSKKKQPNNANRGSALVTVLVVLMVVMSFVLLLILEAYQYYSMSGAKQYRLKCEELATTASHEISLEITKPRFASKEEEAEALADGKHGLWFYLRYNVGQANWPYFDNGSLAAAGSGTTEFPGMTGLTGSTDEKTVSRTFHLSYKIDDAEKNKLAAAGVLGVVSDTIDKVDDQIPDDVAVTMYWEPGKAPDVRNGSKLHVQVTVRMGSYSYSSTQVYLLTTRKYPGTLGTETMVTANPATGVNPVGNSIYEDEQWIWNWYGSE